MSTYHTDFFLMDNLVPLLDYGFYKLFLTLTDFVILGVFNPFLDLTLISTLNVS